jgi:hypothetical protein
MAGRGLSEGSGKTRAEAGSDADLRYLFRYEQRLPSDQIADIDFVCSWAGEWTTLARVSVGRNFRLLWFKRFRDFRRSQVTWSGLGLVLLANF